MRLEDSLTPRSPQWPRTLGPNAAISQRHTAIQRQLRFVFIYPLVYLFMWIPPFVSHAYRYIPTAKIPYFLSNIGILCLTLQCAADCLAFNLQEQPWRQVTSTPYKGWWIFSSSRTQDEGSIVEFTTAPVIERAREAPKNSRQWWDPETSALRSEIRREGSDNLYLLQRC